MKKCELCNSLAKIYCESDQAILCWDCDTKVHGANFLVAKHSRALLCRLCQSRTRWSAAGPKLGATVSVCDHCVNTSSSVKERIINGENPQNSFEDADEEEEEEEEDTDDEEEENQVVPLSVSSSSQSRTGLFNQTAEPSDDQDHLGSSFSPESQKGHWFSEADTTVP